MTQTFCPVTDLISWTLVLKHEPEDWIQSNSQLSEVLDHQVAACVKGDFLSNFLYILIIFKQQIPKDDLSKLNFRW